MRYILIFLLFFSWSATSNAQGGIEWMSIEEAEALVKPQIIQRRYLLTYIQIGVDGVKKWIR